MAATEQEVHQQVEELTTAAAPEKVLVSEPLGMAPAVLSADLDQASLLATQVQHRLTCHQIELSLPVLSLLLSAVSVAPVVVALPIGLCSAPFCLCIPMELQS